MTEEERREHIESALRRIDAIKQIPDDPNDPPDEEWIRAIGEPYPHRPVFKGCHSVMQGFVLLDSGPLGPTCRRHRRQLLDRCPQWPRGLIMRGVGVVMPEISDYDVPRERTRIRPGTSLRRLNDLVRTGALSYVPITAAEWH